jgi:WD40 repeat protein
MMNTASLPAANTSFSWPSAYWAGAIITVVVNLQIQNSAIWRFHPKSSFKSHVQAAELSASGSIKTVTPTQNSVPQQNPPESISVMAFSSDGNMFATADKGGLICFWDGNTASSTG